LKFEISNRLPAVCASSLALFCFLAAGCKGPNPANIELRKENQQLRARVDELNRRHDADVAQIRATQTQTGAVVPTLSPGRLDQLFTVHGIQLGRLTGVNPEGELKVYVTPTDESGQSIKAAGSFVIDAFDLARADHPQIGHWEFPVEAAKRNWVGQALLHCYVLSLPWQGPGGAPEHPQLTVRVVYTDALTGRVFETQKVVRVDPRLSASTSQPAGR
jgi:hypothetical protein